MKRSKLYTKLLNAKEWQELRIRKLRDSPLCEICERKGYIVPARVVHHIIEVESGRSEQECRALAYSYNNLQSLCRECHAEVHKDRGSHSKEAHEEKARARLQLWIEKHGNNN